MVNKSFWIVVLAVSLFVGYMLGYSIPPFLQSGAFSDRAEKGVAIEIDENMEEYYEDLYKEQEEEK